MLSARAQGRLAVGLHLEGTECLERDTDAIDLMYALGIRHSILAFNQNNSAAGGCADLGDVGLSRLGRRYLARMNEVGMLIDLSHTSARAAREVIDDSAAPVVFSHSNAHAVHPHYRNVTDELAKACAARGGVIGISGSSVYVGPSETLAQGVFRHIDHLVQWIDPEHVGFGTDYVEDAATVSAIFAQRPDEWPSDGSGSFDDVRYLPPEDLRLVVALMTQAGYPGTAIDAIVGVNFFRLAGLVWK